jgi:hypothetical protein
MSNTGLSATESAVQQTVPMAGTLSEFYVTLNGSPGSGRGYTFVVRKNGVNTLVTCTISGTATTGSDVTNSVSFAAGDKISIRVTPVNNPTARSMSWTAKFSPAIMPPGRNGHLRVVFALYLATLVTLTMKKHLNMSGSSW